MPVYGHHVPGFGFEPALETKSDGFVCRGKAYAWKDVVRIDARRWSLAGAILALILTLGFFVPSSRAYVHLADGVVIFINADLVKDGQRRERWGWESAAFKELLELLESGGEVG